MATSSQRGRRNRSGTNNNNYNNSNPWGSSWRLIRRVPSNRISENFSNMHMGVSENFRNMHMGISENFSNMHMGISENFSNMHMGVSSSSSSSSIRGPYSLQPRGRTVPENPSGSTPWGIEVKPGHPYTYHPEEARSGLTITKASVGDGSTGFATHLYCTVGPNGHPFWIGWLPPHKTEVIMDVYQYVKETEVVIFTVFGPQPVYLSGYYINMVEEHAVGE